MTTSPRVTSAEYTGQPQKCDGTPDGASLLSPICTLIDI